MTMKVTRLTTYWTIDEAATAIEFLDILRDGIDKLTYALSAHPG